MALTDISLLFKDIIETPQQKQQRLFAEGQAAAGQFTGLPTGLRELAMGTASGIPGTVESIRQFGAAAGLPVQTQGEQLQRSLSGLNMADPASQREAVRLLSNIDPLRGAAAAEIFAEEERKQKDRKRRIELETAREGRAVEEAGRAASREERAARQETAQIAAVEAEAEEEAQAAANTLNFYQSIIENTDDPVLQNMARSAIENDITDATEFNTIMTAIERAEPDTIEQEILDTKATLMSFTDPDTGENMFTEDEARQIATGIARDQITIKESADGALVLTDILKAQANVPGAVITLPPQERGIAKPESFEGATIWDNKDLLSGAWNKAAAAIDVPLALAGFEGSINTGRHGAQQQVMSALSLLRRAFDNDNRLTGVEIQKFAEEIALEPRWFDAPLLWEARAISVDRTLEGKLAAIQAELTGATTSSDRRSELREQSQAISDFRRELGVPKILDIGRVTIENIESFSKEELQAVLNRTSDERIVEWESSFPDVAEAIRLIFQ